MTGQHVRPGNVGPFQQRMQVRGNVGTVLRAVRCVAPAATSAVVHADPGVAGHGRGDPAEVGGGRAMTRFQDDRGTAGAGAVQVQPMAADVDQPAGWRIGPGLERSAYGLVAAAHRGDRQHGQNGIQQPPCASAAHLASGLHDHPDDEPEQDGRPDPAQHSVHGSGPTEGSEADQRHERGRRGGPPLRLVAEPGGQDGQQGPPHRKPQQHHPGQGVLPDRNERSRDKGHGDNQSRSHG